MKIFMHYVTDLLPRSGYLNDIVYSQADLFAMYAALDFAKYGNSKPTILITKILNFGLCTTSLEMHNILYLYFKMVQEFYFMKILILWIRFLYWKCKQFISYFFTNIKGFY